MNFQSITIATVMLSICLTAETSSAQLPAGLPGGLSGKGGGSASAAAADRVQAQVQQRVQAQVQQRLQTQVQARAQAQAQARIQAETRRAAEIAVQAAARASDRAKAAAGKAENGKRLGVGVSADARSNANVAGQSARLGADTRFGLRAGASLPPGISEADVAIYDNIFGRFNPLRTGANASAEKEPSSSGKNTAQSKRSNEQRPNQAATPEHSDALVGSAVDLAARINVAARQRRAQISEMRDHAVATGKAELLLQADELEQRLNAFASAQSEMQARVQADANAALTAGTRTASDSKARVTTVGQAKADSAMKNAKSIQGRAKSVAASATEIGGQAQVDAQAGGSTTLKGRTANRTSVTAEGAASGSSKVKR